MNLAKLDPVERETNHDIVLGEMRRLLRDDRFASAPQMSAFLRYVVTQTLEGNGGRIKAYTIGVDALGKPDSFDAQHDPSVRVLALRLRKALKLIYESDQPAEAIIELKLGSYAPEFYQAKKLQSSAYGQINQQLASGSQYYRKQSGPETRVAGFAPAANREHTRHPQSQTLENSASGTSPVANSLAVYRGDSVKYAIMLLIASALLYSIGLKLVGDWRASTGFGHLSSVEADMPVLLLSMTSVDPVEPQSIKGKATTPSVLLATGDGQSEHLKKVSMLVSASLVESAGLTVAMSHNLHTQSLLANNDYMILFNEALVDYKSRIDAQILRVDTGAVVMSETLEFNTRQTGFSAEELESINAFTQAVSDPSGPVSVDYCRHSKQTDLENCVLGKLELAEKV